MPKIFVTGLLVSAISAIVACSEPTAPASSEASSEVSGLSGETSAAAQGALPQAQVDAMAKAAATSSVLEQAEQERRKQMDAQGL
jgi:hypothetical protein